MPGFATAHNVETLFGGEKVRSKPATVVATGRDARAMKPDNSRASNGARPNSTLNRSRATRVRIPARASTETGAVAGCPRDRFRTAIWRATSTRNADASPLNRNGDPSRTTPAMSVEDASSPKARTSSGPIGLVPEPNNACICSAVTTEPANPGRIASHPVPTHTPGVSPRSE